MIDAKHTLSDKAVAYNGALLAIRVVLAYSLAVMFWVVMYSSTIIYSIMPVGKRSFILFASGFSMAYSVVVFSLLLALISALAGALIAILLKKLLLYFNPVHEVGKAYLVSGATVVSAVTLGYLLLLTTGLVTFGVSDATAFWFIMPAILLSISCVVRGSKLNAALSEPRQFSGTGHVGVNQI